MMRLHQLAQLVGGNLTSAQDPVINGAASITRATDTQITFACSEKHHEQFLSSNAAAAIIPKTIETSDKPCIRVETSKQLLRKSLDISNRQSNDLTTASVLKPSLAQSPPLLKTLAFIQARSSWTVFKSVPVPSFFLILRSWKTFALAKTSRFIQT